LKDSLQDIKEMQLRTLSMLESQQRTITKQMDQISFLSAELETLKTAVGERSGAEKDERIRRLELEVEELRSQI
jgi:coronin-1B/1C/6